MEIQLRKLFQPRRYRIPPTIIRGEEKYHLLVAREIDFSDSLQEGRNDASNENKIRTFEGGRIVSLIFKFASVDRAHVSVSLQNFVRGISGELCIYICIYI